MTADRTSDPAEFLLARIAEDEAECLREIEEGYGGDQYESGWSSNRVLAECEAKRQVVEAYREERARRDAYQSEATRAFESPEQAERRRGSAARCRGLEIAVQSLALAYVGHAERGAT